MIYIKENIFDYNLSFGELELLNVTTQDEASYLQATTPQKILSDLHLLFLIRKDEENYNRVLDKITNLEEWA